MGRLRSVVYVLVWALALALAALPLFARTITLTTPNGGEWYEPGQTVTVQWTAGGTDWQAGDQVKIEYSTDAGANWTVFADARRWPYNAPYQWSTSGYAQGSAYRIRVTQSNDHNVFDSSAGNFTLLPDTASPTIVHEPVQDSGDPSTFCATITDNTGVQSATLYLSKNGGEFTPVTMSLQGSNLYCGNRPGSSVAGDEFRYYVTATDVSAAHNAARVPATGSYRLGNVTCTSDTISNSGTFYTPEYAGNIYYCAKSAWIRGIAQYMSAGANNSLHFWVYESASRTGTYTLLWDKTVSSGVGGQQLYSAGDMSVKMQAGNYYLICAGGADSRRYLPSGSTTTSFGRAEGGFSTPSTPGSAVTVASVAAVVANQLISTCEVSRALFLQQPNGGEWYVPGDSINAVWNASGPCWKSGDTVRLEYSPDSGTTWYPVSGAASIAYTAGSFSFSTTGLVQGTQEKVRVVANADPTVLDGSNAVFTIQPDTTPPAIMHTPLDNTSNKVGPYRVIATVTDNYRLGSVTLVWSKNGGATTAVPMETTGTPGMFYADIPGPSSVGDVYAYHIESTDEASTPNVGRSPASGEYQFSIIYKADFFTEVFDTDAPFDLDYTSITFTPDGSTDFYATSATAIAQLPTDPAGGTQISIADNDYYPITTSGSALSLYGTSSGRVYVGSNGYITFYSPDTDSTISSVHHFTLRRISGLLCDLDPVLGGRMSWKELSDRCAISFVDMRLHSDSTKRSTFQIEMFFDGRIRLSYLNVDVPVAVVGLSRGSAPGFTDSDLSKYVGGRAAALIAPNGGELYEPGDVRQIKWACVGDWWLPADTLKLDLSSDGGASWNPISGAATVPCVDGSFTWDTTGVPVSDQGRLRTTHNGLDGTGDASDADFTVGQDSTPPEIVHTGRADTGSAGPYPVCADVSDSHGLASVTLFWSKNGGAYSGTAMSVIGTGQYWADIPGANVGDVIRYHVQATDNSRAANTTTSPTYTFARTSCSSEFVGTDFYGASFTTFATANVFECTQSTVLTGIEQYMYFATSTQLRFFVYEGTAPTGGFSKIYEYTMPETGVGSRMFSSGPMSVKLTAGRSYAVGVQWMGQANCYIYTYSLPFTTSFGNFTGYWIRWTDTLSPTIDVSSTQRTLRFQRLSTCLEPRVLTITEPSVAKWYEPGDTIPIGWSASGPGWQSGDKVRLDYSSDGGTTWTPIASAQSLAYNAGTFSWDSAGAPQSDAYRFRVTSNADDRAFDVSDVNCTLLADNQAPVIAHTPLQDAPAHTAPWSVKAVVTDNRGIGAVTLYWKLESAAEFTALPMTATGQADEYAASIPAGLPLNSRVCYYITATDTAAAANTASYPANAPADRVCFTILGCSTDEITGVTTAGLAGPSRGNIYLCAEDADLTEICQFASLGAATEVRFQVYECLTQTGTYSRISDTVISVPANTAGVFSSGPINVRLHKNRYYAVVAAASSVMYEGGTAPVQTKTMVGDVLTGCYNASAAYPPNAAASFTAASQFTWQKLSACRVSRHLKITQPNGGEWSENGIIDIRWSAFGCDWKPDDTVQLLYSADGGQTYLPISGAENLAYNAGAFSWDTASLPASSSYRVQVVFNADGNIYDVSDADFTVGTDTTPPVIVHTPLRNTSLTNARTCSATISDAVGVAGAKLFWSKNGSPYTEVAMSNTGSATWNGSIPGTTAIGDVVTYYIEATDNAKSPNTGRSPATGYYSYTMVPQPDFFTQMVTGYDVPYFDLNGVSVTFTPDGSTDYYSACTSLITDLPTDPAGGADLILGINAFQKVTLAGEQTVNLYGNQRNEFYVGSNGYITLDAGDATSSGSYIDHFKLKRISGLFTYLDPSAGGVSWKQLSDRIAVTFKEVPLASFASGTVKNTFQMEMFFDGRIRLSYLYVNSASRPTCIGISEGLGPQQPDYPLVFSDLSSYPPCCQADLSAVDSIQPATDASLDFGMLPLGEQRTESVDVSNLTDCITRTAPGRVVNYLEDFNDNLAQDWQEDTDASWTVANGQYSANSPTTTSDDVTATYGGTQFGDGYFEVRIKQAAPVSGQLKGVYVSPYIVWRASGDIAPFTSPIAGTGYVFSYTTYAYTSRPACTIMRISNGARTTIASASLYSTDSTGDDLVGVNVQGNKFDIYMNGRLLMSVTDNAFQSGRFGLGMRKTAPYAAGCVFDDVAISAPLSQGTGGFTVSDPYAEDFGSGIAKNWQPRTADWSVAGGEYRAYLTGAGSADLVSTFSGMNFGDGFFQVRVKTPGADGVSALPIIFWRATPDVVVWPALNFASGIYMVFEPREQGAFSIYRASGNYGNTLISYGYLAPGDYTGNDLIRIDAVGNTFTVSINGRQLTSAIDSYAIANGRVGLGCRISTATGAGCSFDDIIVGTSGGLRRLLTEGDTQQASITFAPTVMGEVSSKLLIRTDRASQMPVVVQLKGIGVYGGQLGEVKDTADEGSIAVSGKIVSAVFAGRFYVQDDNRGCGIGVVWTGAMPEPGDIVTVVGKSGVEDGERLVRATFVRTDSHTDPPLPIGIGSVALGGGGSHYTPGPPARGQEAVYGGYGANNIGLLIRTWGRVVEHGPAIGGQSPSWFIIEDGGTGYIPNGNPVAVRVRVVYPGPIVQLPEIGSMIAVTGASSCYRENGVLQRAVLVP